MFYADNDGMGAQICTIMPFIPSALKNIVMDRDILYAFKNDFIFVVMINYEPTKRDLIVTKI